VTSRAALVHRKTRASVSLCVAVCCNVLQSVAVYEGASGRAISRMVLVRGEKYVHVCCSVLQYVAVCCNVLQCVAVCCSVFRGVAAVWQCVAVYIGARIQGRREEQRECVAMCCRVLRGVVVCCRLLQTVADCCRVLQCVAEFVRSTKQLCMGVLL